MIYETKGTCAKEIQFGSRPWSDPVGGICVGLSRLYPGAQPPLVGMGVEDAIAQLKGIQCLQK
jgi:hypothetical protein